MHRHAKNTTHLGDMGIIRGLLADAEAKATQRAIDALRTTLATHHTTDGIYLGGAAWLVTAQRRQ